MPSLDIATPQPSFRNHLYSLGFQTLHHVSANQKTARWRYFHKPNPIIINPSTLDISSTRLMIKAVATLEPRCSSDKENDNAQQLSIDSTDGQSTSILDDKEMLRRKRISIANKGRETWNKGLRHTPDDAQQQPIDSTDTESSLIQDDKEILRRKRISKANKGKEAWNKGIRHSPETRQKIRERTKIAMHDPKVRMKLLKATHSQSHETRLKIGAAVRLTWDRSRIKRRMIVRCHHEWLNLIAEASRKGLYGEQELQWDSYEMLKEQHEKEYQEGIEARRKPTSTRGRRSPKTPEQRRKISEAIAAKWADPAYRDRVHSGMVKRGRSSKTRDPAWGTRKKEAKKIKPEKKETRMRASRGAKLKTSVSQARYKDPQAGYKLEMIKSIRAQRAGSDPKIREAVARANVLIGEAQRAAEALEVAAAKSPMAEASLVETRKLIAEAISYIKSIEMVNTPPSLSPDVKKEIEQEPSLDVKKEIEQIGVNGVGVVGISNAETGRKHEDVVANGKEHIDASSSSSSSWGLQVEEDGGSTMASEKEERGGKGRRRWVCGRLVEVEEELVEVEVDDDDDDDDDEELVEVDDDDDDDEELVEVDEEQQQQ